MQPHVFKRSLVALAVAAAFGLGAIAADRHGAAPTANAAPALACLPGGTVPTSSRLPPEMSLYSRVSTMVAPKRPAARFTASA